MVMQTKAEPKYKVLEKESSGRSTNLGIYILFTTKDEQSVLSTRNTTGLFEKICHCTSAIWISIGRPYVARETLISVTWCHHGSCHTSTTSHLISNLDLWLLWFHFFILSLIDGNVFYHWLMAYHFSSLFTQPHSHHWLMAYHFSYF